MTTSSSSGSVAPPSANQSTKPFTPAWTIIPTQERSSAPSSRTQRRSASIRATAAVLNDPEAARSCRVALLCAFGPVGDMAPA